MGTFKRRLHIGRALKIAAVAIAGCLTLLLLSLPFLPMFVSSHAAQSRIQRVLSTSMKRQVTWSNLAMTWKGGLVLSALRLGDGPAPLLNADIARIVIVPSAGRGSDGRFGIDLAVRIRGVRAELAPGAPKAPPPKTARDPLTLLAESIQRVQGLDFPLPVDLRVMIDAAPLQVSYRDIAPGKTLRLEDFSFRFAMPSLAAKPVTAEVNGRLSVDGREAGKVSCNARVSDLVTRAGRIHLASALFAVDAAAPGTTITLSGGLSQTDGFTARWKTNIEALLEVARPLLPPTLPKLAGNVELHLRAKSDAKRDLRATLTLDGVGLAAELKGRRVGPLDLRLQQQIATDHAGQRVDFPGGVLALPGLIDASWSASVLRPTLPDRSLAVKFGPLRLELARALSLAAPFLPPGTPVKDLAGEAFLRSLTLHLNGPGNSGDLAVTGLGIKILRVRLALEKGELAGEDVDLLLEKLECPLAARLPTGVTADLLWSIRKAALLAPTPLTLQGGRGKFGVVVTGLNLKSASPRKVAAAVVLTQSLDIERAALGTALTADRAHERLRLLARAKENGEIEADLPDFAVTIASLEGVASGKRLSPVPLSASLTAAGLRLPAQKGGRPALQSAAAVISAGDFVRLSADAALSGGSPRRAATKGSARVDLRRAMPFAAPFAPSGLKASGVVSAVWDLAALLPEKGAAAEKHPLRRGRAGLSLFDKLDLSVKLDNISVTVPSAGGAITVSSLRSKPDLRMVSAKNGDSARLEGGVLFSGVSGLPGAAGKLPIQHGSFVFDGELSGWNEFRLSEELHIDPLGVAHEAELNVSRIDALLEEKQPFSAATMIKRLDATLFANVDVALSREFKPLLSGFDVAGNISSGIRADLSAGRELALRYALKTMDFGAQLANGTRVEGLRSDIAINRVYALAATKGESWTPLSAALVRPAAVITANPGAEEIAGRIHEDLRGDVRGSRSFSIRSITAKTSGVPLLLTALEGDLLFTREKVGLSFFQADLLGGTLLARGVFDLRPEIPNIAAASSFSNLDITHLLPKEKRRGGVDRDAEVTGEITLSAPLTAEQRELLEQLRLALNIRKIGANTIERALFSLDPYERNEQLVAQRKMLRLGALKGLRANAVDGAFSMEGEAQIKGVEVELPKVERLRISELPIRQELVKSGEGIKALRGFLDLLRADTLLVGPKGELSLKRRIYAQ